MCAALAGAGCFQCDELEVHLSDFLTVLTELIV